MKNQHIRTASLVIFSEELWSVDEHTYKMKIKRDNIKDVYDIVPPNYNIVYLLNCLFEIKLCRLT